MIMMEKDYNRLKTWLPPLMKRANLTAEKLGMKVGVSRTAVYNWMSDSDRPEPETMAKVCRVLGVPLQDGLRQYTPKKRGNPYFGPDNPWNREKSLRTRKR